MRTFGKRILQTLFVTFALVGAFIFANIYSNELSSHRASLECRWVENSPNAREHMNWPDNVKIHFQIREDFIKKRLIGYRVASGVEGGARSHMVFEKTDKYYYTVRGADYTSKTEFDRETLKTRTVFAFDEGGKVWIGGDCITISPEAFEIEKERAIEVLKNKQRI
jgi:hypothetical protein